MRDMKKPEVDQGRDLIQELGYPCVSLLRPGPCPMCGGILIPNVSYYSGSVRNLQCRECGRAFTEGFRH